MQGAMVAVKQEKPVEADEAEISAMAAKIVEDNRAKMATATTSTTNRVLTIGPGGQTTLTGYIAKGNPAKPQAACIGIPQDKKPIDEDSQRGRFGWTVLGTAPIPYIVRHSELYCAVRMVEMKLLNKFLSYLNADIYNYTNIRSYYITDAEARVLNEINLKHCDALFGRDSFIPGKDVVVRMQDASEFHSFLEICYTKLSCCSNNPKDRCGFIRINNESVVPYTLKGDTKYVPLFYFEGETDSLKLKAINLEGWDLAYLKFCCKVQGIRNELFASETCSVISLEDIRNYFPGETRFDDYWPSKTADSQLITKNPVANASWTRTPAGVTPVVAAAALKPAAQPLRSFPAVHTPPVAGTPGPAASLPPSVINSWTNGSILHQQHATMPQNSLAARMQSMHNALPNSNASYASTMRWPSTPATPYYYPQVTHSMSMPMQQQKPHPPPLVRNPQQHNASAAVDGSRPYAALHKQHQQARAQTNVTSAGERYGRIGAEIMDLSSQQQQYSAAFNGLKNKLIQIDEIPLTNRTPPPYQIYKTIVDGKVLSGINMTPYNTDQHNHLLTIRDLAQLFFPHSDIMTVIKVLNEVLKVNLYFPNMIQTEVLRGARKCTGKEPVPLISVKDATQYMPQLKYMLITKQQNTEAALLQAKRQRLS